MHVPFCTDRCTYCAFATVADRPEQHERLVSALLSELGSHALAPKGWDTVYLGGGTPGLLSIRLLERLLQGISQKAPISAEAEITIEVNPSNVTPEAVAGWMQLGITRLSVGIQTFADATLSRLGRHHDGEAARRALDLLAERWAGLWSADLLVGWADQSAFDLHRDLKQIQQTAPPHVSVYGLTIEPGTPLHALDSMGTVVRVNGSQMDSYDTLWASHLACYGYVRYEVSNFAVPGAQSRHNQMYWRNADYLGIGPGAASSIHPLRWSNTRDTACYLAHVERQVSARSHVERLTPAGRLLESLGAGLRTREGLETRELDRRFGPGWRAALARGIEELSQHRMIEECDGRLRIPSPSITLADSVATVFARTLLEEPDG